MIEQKLGGLAGLLVLVAGSEDGDGGGAGTVGFGAVAQTLQAARPLLFVGPGGADVLLGSLPGL